MTFKRKLQQKTKTRKNEMLNDREGGYSKDGRLLFSRSPGSVGGVIAVQEVQ